jgi:glycosyltransferase involved in cell wall biosynthesis
VSAQIRIAYTLVCYDAANSGVYKKILDQVEEWKKSGHLVQLFVITDKQSLVEWQKIDPFVIALYDAGFARNLINRVKIVQLAAKSSPSVIYVRDSFPMWLRKSSAPIVIEIQSLVGPELWLRSKSRYLVFKTFARYIYSRVSGAIYVTEELSQKNELQLIPSIPKISIGNGINLNRIQPLPPRSPIKPALFFIGSPNQPWHGVNELVKFAKQNQDVEIDVVGNLADCPTPNIRFHGILNYDEYRAIAARCIAGVGTLNLSAKNMTEDSSLKVREYLALGLPVIVKYRDRDLDSFQEFVLQLPSDGRHLSDFSMEIRAFLKVWETRRVLASQIFNLDISAKEESRLRFFEKVITEYNREMVKEN